VTVTVVDEGISEGRYQTTDGRTVFVPLAAPTPEASNSAPLLSPVFISEIRSTPPREQLGTYVRDSQDQYVELQNLSSSAVPLHVPLSPTRTWKLDGSLTYSFPPATSIAPHGTLLVVSFDPSNASLTERFRRRNNVPPTIPLFGPWLGTLNEQRWTVELLRLPLRQDGSEV